MAIDLGKAQEKIAKHGGLFASKAKEAGDKAAILAKDKAAEAAAFAQEKHREMLVEKYRPLFPDEYLSPDFDRPKMVVIKDEDGRKGIGVCEGSIGWLGKEGDLEVLFLYEEAVPFSGLVFHPKAICDAAYYLDDVYEGGRFINLGCFFEEIQKDKMTELRNIAFELGAKFCSVETIEYSKESSKKRRAFDQKLKVKIPGRLAPSENAHLKEESEEMCEEKRHIEFTQVFTGHDHPQKPHLYWYAQDREILSLIDMRCSDKGNSVKNYEVTIDCASSEAMSAAMAKKIDTTLGKVGVSAAFSLESSAVRESGKKLKYVIEF